MRIGDSGVLGSGSVARAGLQGLRCRSLPARAEQMLRLAAPVVKAAWWAVRAVRRGCEDELWKEVRDVHAVFAVDVDVMEVSLQPSREVLGMR